jgi:hypothetical protein
MAKARRRRQRSEHRRFEARGISQRHLPAPPLSFAKLLQQIDQTGRDRLALDLRVQSRKRKPISLSGPSGSLRRVRGRRAGGEGSSGVLSGTAFTLVFDPV